MKITGTMKVKNPQKIAVLLPFYCIEIILVAFIAVFISVVLRDYAIYKEHSWIETESQFVNAEEYQKMVRQRRYTGVTEYRFVQQTRYRWQYCYEINGGQYYYVTDDHKENMPERQTKNIIVAEDDASLYLLYSSGENLKVSMILFGAIGVFAVAVIAVLIIVQRKLMRKGAGNSNDSEYPKAP